MSIVGNGHLELENLLGSGRSLALRLNRLPGHVSRAEVRVADPFVLGLPVSVEAQFDGLQQDSSYAKQRYGAEVGMRVTHGMRAFLTLGRESTRPGVAAASGVVRADGVFAGVGFRMRRLDDVRNPRRGHRLEIAAERGRKSLSGQLPDDATGAEVLDQDRVRASGRLYHPLTARQTIVVGLDAAGVLGGITDRSDLIRFGGASTLRGYDEDRFHARTAGRGVVEYRYLLDPTSFGFLFLDVGYIDAPALAGVDRRRGLFPGYGIGMRFDTSVGVISASYALSPEAGPTNGRIHLGLTFGL